jgi:hypothetical protein
LRIVGRGLVADPAEARPGYRRDKEGEQDQQAEAGASILFFEAHGAKTRERRAGSARSRGF